MKSPHRWVSLGVCLGLGALLSLGCNSKDKNPMNPGGGGGGGLGTPNVLVTITGIMGSNSYSPNPANVTVGQLVAWKNSGGTTHSATQDGGSGFDTGHIANGAQSDTIRFNTAGDFPYHCSIHGSSMTGTVHVTP